MSPFETLGLPATATAGEVKAAYRRLVSKAHPDHGGDAQTFRELRGAYQSALAVASAPGVCQDCAGSGRQRRANGFSTLLVVCPACNGSGTV